jgi:serine/threonine protein kinase
MHEGGINHHDLHPGNLLVQLNDDEPQLFLIDLLAVRVGKPLTWNASRDNLILLNRWFSLRVSSTDRLRFWHTYCANRRVLRGQAPKGGCFCPHRIREIETRTAASSLAFWRHLDHRCTKTSRRYRRIRSTVSRGHAVADLDRAVVEQLLRDPDAPFRHPGVKLLKDSRSSTVAELELPLHGAMQPVIYKRFRITSRLDPWLSLLRPTGAMRSWLMGHGLRLRLLPTPRPLLVLHRRHHGLDYEGYLLAAKVNDAEELSCFMERLSSLPARKRKETLTPVLEETARLIRALHARRLSHRDLKAANLLIAREHNADKQRASAEPWEPWPLTGSRVWFIDLVGVRLHRQLSRRRKVQNLARLNASFLAHPALSLSDRLRFLLLYLGDSKDWKAWWKQLDAATRAKVARNQRSGRVLC